MFAKLRPRSAYDVMAALSLFILLGGTSYAVATGSIDSREIRNNSVQSADVRNGTLTHRDISGNTLGRLRGARGPQGPQGAPGSQGRPGSQGEPATRLFAYVIGGRLQYGRGATSASVINADGRYTVTFDRDLTGCVAVAEPGMGYPEGGAPATIADYTWVRVEARSVEVSTLSGDGRGIASPFQLAVFC